MKKKLLPIPDFENYFFDCTDGKVKKKIKGELLEIRQLKGRAESTWQLSKNNIRKCITLSVLLYSLKEQF